MAKKKDAKICCEPQDKALGCCKVESVISIDDRGQMVLPKEVRDRAGIEAGDKLAVISCEQGGKISCITLVKADDFADIIKNMLGPMMKEIFE